MSNLLNELGYRMHSGAKFQCNSVNRILSNPIYCGFIKFGDVTSPRKTELQIIDDELFTQAQYILEQRAEKEVEKRHVAMNTKGNTLLSGNVFCAHCGSHIVASSWWAHYTRKDGIEVKKKRYRYLCYHKARNLNDCDGASAYTAEKIDQAISELIRQYLDCILITPKDMAIEKRYKERIKKCRDKKRYLEREREKLTKQLDSLTAEIAKALSGNSNFDVDTLSVAITNTKENLREIDEELAECIRKIEKQSELMDGIDSKYNLFRSWADLYDKATLEIRKMIACQLITRVEVKRVYELSVYLNPSFAQFLGKEAVENLTARKSKVG